MDQQCKAEQAIDDGFSSDQEIKHQEIIVEAPKLQQNQHSHRQEVKFKLPPPEQIKAKTYSLNPDIATGWAPKNDLPVPVPLIFNHKRLDCMIRRISEKQNSKHQLVYLGPRYQNTFYSWFQKPFNFPYSHIKSPTNMRIANRLFSGHNPIVQDSLVFDSFFESANLDCAVKVGERQYDLYIRVDSNTRGHLQWYNFKIKNLQKLQKYKINICNFQKNKSLYTRGMKPYVYSKRKYQKQGILWEQSGDSIRYEKKHSKSSKILNLQYCSTYCLSFQYYTQYDDDEVQMAYCIPYAYSELLNFIKKLQKKTSGKQILSKTKLCTSLGGLEVPLLLIHQNKQNNNHQFISVPKKCVVISGRAHPGQSNGSHMMQGFLQYLCSDSPAAKKLRTYFVFKVVPMLNPDGVALGNYRTGISGKDFNRQYRNPQKSIFPQVFAFKRLVTQNKSIYGDNLLMFLDFHGHSTKKNVFMYGPQFPIIQKHYYQCRVFPKLLSNITNMFRYYSCTFKVSEFKQTTARAVLLRKLMIPFSYTIEASNGSYYDTDKLKDVCFTTKHWQNMGRKIGECLSTYGQMIIASQKNRIQKRRQRIRKREVKKTIKGKSLGGISNNNNYGNDTLAYEKTILADNQQLKNIFEQIRNAQKQRQKQHNQDDDISQGSSDGQGQKDDLTQQKLNFLYSVIKNKKLNGTEKFKKKMQQCSKTNQIQQRSEDMSQQLNDFQREKEEQSSIDMNDTIFRSNQQNLRGNFLKNNKISHTTYLGEQKSSKVAAKIINFSFVGQNRPSHSPKRNIMRHDLSEIPSLRKNGSDLGQEQKINSNKRVLDLSDSSFRQTFASNMRTNDRFVIIDPKSTTYHKTSPRKIINRLDQFKYRRLFIDQYRI